MKNAPALYEQELKQVFHSLLRFVLQRLTIGSLRYGDYGLRLTVKDVTAHDQNLLTVHFSRVVLWLR